MSRRSGSGFSSSQAVILGLDPRFPCQKTLVSEMVGSSPTMTSPGHSIPSSSTIMPLDHARGRSARSRDRSRRGRRARAARSGAWCRRPRAWRNSAPRSRLRLLVDAVERVHQAIAEGVGVDVERRMDEVRDVGPEGLVARPRRIAGPRLSACTLIQISPSCSAVSSPLARARVDLALEAVERDLAHDRVDHVLDLGGEHRLALLAARRSCRAARGRSASRRRRDAVSARVSGVGAISAPLRRGQHLVHAVAEFMGERHHVARLALVVEQHVGMGATAPSDARRRPAPCRAAPARRSSARRRSAGRCRPSPARSRA